MPPLRLKCIACDVLARPVYLAAAYSPQIVDVHLVPFGLHSTPNKLRDLLQQEINLADQAGFYDAVVLAYGLCGKATQNLQAASLPFVVPRAHDCITLFLGGRSRYDHEFLNCPGTYWYVKDYLERGDSSETPLSIGAHTSADRDELYAVYVEKYGVDNAEYLLEVMEAWHAHYERAAFIDLEVGEAGEIAARAKKEAQKHGWQFVQLAGDLVLIKRLLDGDWDDNFLVLKPGQRIVMAGGEDIIQADPAR